QSMMDALRAYNWPGNLRQLRNVVEATIALGEVPRLEGYYGKPVRTDSSVENPGVVKLEAQIDGDYKSARRALLDRFEAAYFTRLITQTRGNASAASRTARIDRTYLLNKLRRHGLR